MTRHIRHLLLVAGLALAAFGLAAQDYPSRSIRLVVPQPPGGPTDIVARLIGQELATRLGQPIVFDNRPGAGSNIGTDIVAKSPNDGYTLVLATVQHIVNQFLFASLPFDPVRDFAPITLLSKAQIVLVVHPEVPARNLGELVKHLKSQPGKVAWAYAGNGGTGHLALEAFKRTAGLDVIGVPYKGTQPALADLLGGQVSVMFDGVVTSMPHIRSGKLRPIAVAGLTRSALLPDVPTIAESGYPGFEAAGLAGLLAPAGTPPAILERLHRESAAVLALPHVREKLASMGLEVVGSSPKEFAAYIRSESERLGKVIREAGIRAE